MACSQASGHQLRRQLGVTGATLMGLGAILGTGVFVTIGLATGIAGPAVIPALVLAAGLATCNALSSAQLAAAYPVSGGTYEHGYRCLGPWLGFSAGWVFLAAKGASAATAALGFAGYLINSLALADEALVPIATLTVVGVTGLVLAGIRRTNAVNRGIVAMTLASLLALIINGLPTAWQAGGPNLTDFTGTRADDALAPALLEATALMFVAYTGYARIATLGEEVREPARTIPRAIIITLIVSMGLYTAVGLIVIATVGAERLGALTQAGAAPLQLAAAHFAWPGVPQLLAIGALTAMLGVLVNLILGLSRVLLAMSRRGDMPAGVGRINAAGTTPYVAVLIVGGAVLGLALIGDIKTTWSFSAFTVLVYYAITNAAALTLPADQRRYPRWIATLGVAGCGFLTLWIETSALLAGLGLIATGWVWHSTARRLRHR